MAASGGRFRCRRKRGLDRRYRARGFQAFLTAQYWSSLPCRALRRSTGRQSDPRMATLLPHRDSRGGETWIGEVADGNADESWKACVLPEHSRPARWTEMKGHDVAAVGRPLPLGGFAGDRDLVIPKARLVADHGAGASPACQAVAHSI